MFEVICGCIIYLLFMAFILIMIVDAFKKYDKRDDERLDNEINHAIKQSEAKSNDRVSK